MTEKARKAAEKEDKKLQKEIQKLEKLAKKEGERLGMHAVHACAAARPALPSPACIFGPSLSPCSG